MLNITPAETAAYSLSYLAYCTKQYNEILAQVTEARANGADPALIAELDAELDDILIDVARTAAELRAK